MKYGKKLAWLLAMAMVLSTAQPAMAAGNEAAAVMEEEVTGAAEAEAAEEEEPAEDQEENSAVENQEESDVDSEAEADEADSVEEAAEEEDAAEEEGISGSATGEAIPIEVKGLESDADEALEDYLEFEASGESISTANRHNLNTKEKAIYDYLKAQVQKVAAGELASTTFSLSAYSTIKYSASDLGVESITNDNINDVITTATEKFDSEIRLTKVTNSLFADMPYEFYWCKSHGISYSHSYGYSSSYVSVSLGQISFTVNDELASAAYTVDTTKTGAAADAAAAAEAIVTSAVGLSDYEILNKYKEEICSLVSYDYDAAYADASALTDESPWQMINVFDGDEDTKVVCEGYSKAFKFLCDETSFKSSKIECRLATGYMDGGGHMWNIVTMNDGNNYLADVTNSDDGSIGCNGGLFLNGYSSGSVADGYVFAVPGQSNVTYVYKDAMSDIYTEDELTLSASDYDPDQEVACDHSSTTVVNAKAASCTTDGYTGDVVCNSCGETISTGTVITATGHDYKETSRTEATCTKAGSVEYTCSVCGDVKTETIAATGHKSENVAAVAATCVKSGSTAGTKCSVCGEILSGCETIAATGEHTYEETSRTDATCGKAGSVEYTCSVCGDVKTETIVATGEHSYKETSRTEATCTEEGSVKYICSVCGDAKTETIAATGHTAETVAAVAATCVKSGCTAGTKCSVCGEILSGCTEIPATGEHTYKETSRTEATCGKAGSVTYTCSVCGDVKTETIEATGEHSYKETSRTEATCTEAGSVKYTCSVCGTEKTETIAATGHKSENVAAVAATCVKSGCTAGTKCSVCGEILSGCTEIPATGEHTYEETSRTDATCGKAGSVEYTCSVCGDVKTETIAATGEHTYEEISRTEATCTEGGSVNYKCSVCGAEKTETIATTGHKSENVAAVEATYTSTGSTAGTKCSVCGEILSGCETIAKKTLAAPVISVANTTSGMKITWNKVTDAQKYKVYYKVSGASSYTSVYTTATNYTVPSSKLTSGKTYYFVVKAMLTENSTNVYSANSSTKSLVYLSAVKPSSLANASTGITIKWAKVTGASGYKIYRKTGSENYTCIKTIGSGSTVSYTDTGVKSKNGVTYTYAVRAMNGSVLGAYAEASVLRLTGITASTPTNSASKKMTVKWTPNTKATGVQIQYSTSSTFASGNKTVTVKSSTTKSTVISSLTKGKTYYVRIRCYKGSTWSAWGNTVKVKITK